jgi:hypothetical protein
MDVLKRRSIVQSLRLCGAAAAMVFLMSSAPAAAPKESCPACDNCYSALPCYQCASYVVHAIGNCCGSNPGWSSCVNTSWGFYARCNYGRECRCNAAGGNCVTLEGEKEGKEY